MPRTPSVFQLDPFDQHKLDLLHAAAIELWIGPERDDLLVQSPSTRCWHGCAERSRSPAACWPPSAVRRARSGCSSG